MRSRGRGLGPSGEFEPKSFAVPRGGGGWEFTELCIRGLSAVASCADGFATGIVETKGGIGFNLSVIARGGFPFKARSFWLFWSTISSFIAK
jgi:hypothetical protein